MSDFRIVFVVGLLISGVIFAIFQAPPLTDRGSSSSTAINEERFEAYFNQELNFCEAQPNDYDCQCYARVSGVVQSSATPPLPAGVQRIDRKYLARVQASGRC